MKNADRMNKDIERVLKTLNRLSQETVNDLCRRAGTRALKEPGTPGPRGRGTHTDPTLTAVMRSMSEKRIADPIYDSVRELALVLADMVALAQKIDEKVRYVTQPDKQAKEAAVICCEACGREVAGTPKDRVRSGYCSACYADWTRSGRPYRAQFEAERREKAEK